VCRYNSLDPISAGTLIATKIEVVDECCLSVARRLGGRACLLVNGREIGEWIAGSQISARAGQLGLLCNTTTLQPAMAAGGHEGLPIPRWGGIYVPNVLVFRDSEGTTIPHFRMPMLYACASWFPRGAIGGPKFEQFRDEMQEKVRNVLRICHLHGHSDLILGAWGCGQREAPANLVANVFRNALLESGDTARLFQRVVFAVPSYSPGDAFDAFSREFSDLQL